MWKLNRTVISNQWAKDEIAIKISLKMNENKNTTYWNLCDAAKTVLRRKFNVMNTYVKKEKKS